MIGTVIFDKIIGQLIAAAIGAAVAMLGAWLKNRRNISQRGKEVLSQEEWDSHATTMKAQIQAVLDESRAADERNSAELQKQSVEIAKVSDNVEDVRGSVVGIKKALLTIHLNNLIKDSQLYLSRGYITTVELEDYQSRYETYKLLGGNGHMDMWYPKVVNLPVPNQKQRQKIEDSN